MSASWTRHARSISTRQTSMIPPNGREAAVLADQAACAENLTGDTAFPIIRWWRKRSILVVGTSRASQTRDAVFKTESVTTRSSGGCIGETA
jgi:hypothetical protein